MSSKLKLKSTAGGSLSLAVDDALATDETLVVPNEGFQPLDEDHGITRGTWAFGEWTKFPDGTAIVTLRDSPAHPSWIYAFPFTFIGGPTVIPGSRSSLPFIVTAHGVTSTQMTLYRWNPDGSSSNQAYGWVATAIGRWK